jgi:hypothetical protein
VFSGRGKAKQHVIASEAKQSNARHHDPLMRIRLFRRKTPRTDRLSEYTADNRYRSEIKKVSAYLTTGETVEHCAGFHLSDKFDGVLNRKRAADKVTRK